MTGKIFKWGDERRDAALAAPEVYRDGETKTGVVVHLRRVEFADAWVSEVAFRYQGKKFGLKTLPYDPADAVAMEERLERSCEATLRVQELGWYPEFPSPEADEWGRRAREWRARMEWA